MKNKKSICLLLVFVIALGFVVPISALGNYSEIAHVCEESALFTKSCCVDISDSDSIVRNVLYWLNSGYIEFDGNGGFDILYPINADMEFYLSRIAVQTIIQYECNSFECCTNHGNIPVEPFGPSGPCTNIFGHSWGAWGNWINYAPIVHFWNCGNVPLCAAPIERVRWCQRNFCTRYYRETSILFVQC